MTVNQQGHEVFTDVIFSPGDFYDHFNVAKALLLLAEHLNVQFVVTNATKYGNLELRIEKKEVES